MKNMQLLVARTHCCFFISRFTDDDVDEMYREAPIKGSMFDYIEFTRILKHGAKDKDEQ